MSETRIAPTIDARPGDVLRLASCPRCGGRRRALIETAAAVRGHCLGCGADLDVPLAVELSGRVSVVGRGGQQVVG